jgi:hypothetical protein
VPSAPLLGSNGMECLTFKLCPPPPLIIAPYYSLL